MSRDRMRIAIHDYGGYPFIVQLSRSLALRGHDVLHLYASGFRSPKGPMELEDGDAATLTIEPLALSEALQRDGFRRIQQERRYARLASNRIARWRPDVVVSANTPLEVQSVLQATTHRERAAFVFWLQDLHSIAISRILGRRLGFIGRLIGARFAGIERRLLRRSEAVVAISADYLGALRDWKLPMAAVEVIENWAPLEYATQPEAERWAATHGLLGGRVALYAGTLALKHNPALLLDLARGLPEVTTVAAIEGPGADWLREAAAEVPNLRVLPLQPYEAVPAMLARADVLVAILEPDASTFSAPSKVLTYLAAGRPIVAAIPRDNAAAKLIVRTGAGAVAEPTDPGAFVAAARELLGDRDRLAAAARAGRAYAQEAFDIKLITDRFETTIAAAAGRNPRTSMRTGVDTGSAQDLSTEADE